MEVEIINEQSVKDEVHRIVKNLTNDQIKKLGFDKDDLVDIVTDIKLNRGVPATYNQKAIQLLRKKGYTIYE